MSEIVTLQFGNYSNYVGAHWWNSIENTFVYNGEQVSEINHDILYRVGSTQNGSETYTPRLLLVDLNNSLGHMSVTGDLYSDGLQDKPDPNWEEDVDVINEPKIEQNPYIKDIESTAIGVDTKDKRSYELDTFVNTWTDYLYTRFHPRTINVVKEYQHGDTEKKFDTLTCGQELWKSEQFQEDYCDRLRKYIEECDHLQGFHITLDSTDGFAGIAASCIEYARDEYSGNILAIPLISSGLSADPTETSTRIVNLALCYRQLIENSSAFIPMSLDHTSHWRKTSKVSLPHIKYKSDHIFQTSAVIASALDTITLPYRLRSNGGYSLSGCCRDISGSGRKMVAASIGLPFGIAYKTDLIDHLDALETSMFTSLTPNCTIGTDKMLQLFSLRGISEETLKKPLRTAGKQLQMGAYKYDSVKDMMEFYFGCNSYGTATNVTTTSSPFKIPSSFPQFFNDNVNKNGLIDNIPREENENVVTTPIIAGLHSTPKMFDTLTNLIREVERIKIAKIHRFKEAGLESDEYLESISMLKEFQECYEDNMYL